MKSYAPALKLENQKKFFSLYVDKELVERIKKVAEGEERSMNSWIVKILRSEVNRYELMKNSKMPI